MVGLPESPMKPTRARPSPKARPTRGLSRAAILDVIDADAVPVRAVGSPAEEVVRAELAVPGYLPKTGDRVIIERVDDAWIILGVLGEARLRQAAALGLVATATPNGVELRVASGDLTLAASGRI